MKISKLSTRETAYIATFGTLWGGCEISLGLILHNFYLPFTGLLLTFIGTIIALTCARLTNKKRAVIYTAIIAAILKMLSITVIKIGPFIGILGSAITAQLIITIFNINLISFIIAGGAMCCFPFIFVLSRMALFYTTEIFKIYEDFLHHIGLKELKISVLILIIMLIHFFIGSLAGILSWKISDYLNLRMKSNAKIT